METNSVPYPATFTFDPPEKIANWRPLVHWLLVIPHGIIVYVLGMVSEVVGLVSWFVILFTGRYPRGLFSFVEGVIRWWNRVTAYAFVLVTDKYPPFALSS